jgi:hypothetical protein
MPITFTCPQCRCKMAVPDSLAGKRGKCSKCKSVVTVPAANGATTAAAPPAANNTASHAPGGKGAASRTAPSPPPAAGPKAETPPAPPEDLEAAALAALADEPAEEQAKKDSSFIEFECPMCFEPVKLSVELGGKKNPCPHCKRIITVPMPKVEQRTSWRDAGPNLPSAARRDTGPALEGAWGSTQKTGPSLESLKDAGVIAEKHKPLTTFQKARPYLLLGFPLALLVAGGLSWYNWMARNKEKTALDFALRFASDEKSRSAVGADGLAALHGGAARYYLNSRRPGSAALARDQLNKAVALAGASRNPECDALLLDLTQTALDLAGDEKDVGNDVRLKWDETQKALRNTLTGIKAPEARLEGLRRAVAGLAEQGQTRRAAVLVAQLYPKPDDRSEALGVAGLEFLRLGKKEDALKACEQAEAPYADKKKRPRLRPAVVALVTALDRTALRPANAKDAVEEENNQIGKAEGLGRQGKPDAARSTSGAINDKAASLRAWVAVAAASADGKQPDKAAFDAALNDRLLRSASAHPWVLLRLLDAGLRAGIPADRLQPAASAIPGPLGAWAQGLLFRSRLGDSKAPESAEVLDKFPANSLAGRVARLELSRHDTRLDGGWANTVRSWEDGPRAFGSLGVALGLQKGK